MGMKSQFKNLIRQITGTGHLIANYFVMPPTDEPVLPQAWLNGLRLKFWPLASLVAGTIPYIMLIIPAHIDQPTSWFAKDQWRYGLLYPIITTYLLLLIPVFRHLLERSVQAFLPFIPNAEPSSRFVREAYQLNRRREWLFFATGMATGWIITPFENLAGFWQVCYALFGEGITFGLLGWLTYSLASCTQILTALHNQTHGLTVYSHNYFSPLVRWSLGIMLALLGGSLMTSLLIPQVNFLSPKNITVYVLLNLMILLIFLRNQASISLMAQFRVLRAFALFTLVALLGTLGYHYLEGWKPLEGLYMTVITMTTIGYGEINPLGPAGRIFTMILSLVSVGVAGYALSAVAVFIFEGDFQQVIGRQRMNKQIATLSNHIILCGAGFIGEQIALEFHKTHTPFVVVDESQEALESLLRIADGPYVLGNATKDDTLILSGIKQARGLIANLNDDKDNAFVVLSARALNPELRIISRLIHDENEEKLRRVGADEIISPGAIGGLRMASVMIRPSVVSFLDEMMRYQEQTLRLEETRLEAGSGLENKTLAEANLGKHTGVLVIAIRSQTGNYQFNPPADTVLAAGDTLIVIATPQQKLALNQLQH